MGSLILQPTLTAEWQTLVAKAQQDIDINLGEELESYLVFMLMRFVSKPEVAKSVLGAELLASFAADDSQQRCQLQDVGDKCLLYSGLFPGRAEKRRVKISYFVQVGRTAYQTLSDLHNNELVQLFNSLCNDFVAIMDVMQAMRDDEHGPLALTPLQASEIWQDIGGRYAKKVLKQISQQAAMFSANQNNGRLH